MRRRIISGLVAACLSATGAHAQLTVYDPAIHIQSILTAARALEEIQQQVEQLQNEANMLINQARNLEQMGVSSAPEMQAMIVRIRSLIDRAQGMAFEINATEAAWARDYPESYAALDNDAMIANARLQWRNARNALGTAIAMQSEVISLGEDDAETLSRLLGESQGAAGNLDVLQAGNELVGLSIAQGLRTQQLLAAQARAESLDRARALEEAEAARVRTQRFLGQEPEG